MCVPLLCAVFTGVCVCVCVCVAASTCGCACVSGADAIRSDMCGVIGSRVCDARGNHGSIWRTARDRTHLVMPTEPRRSWKAFSVCVRHFPPHARPVRRKKTLFLRERARVHVCARDRALTLRAVNASCMCCENMSRAAHHKI